MSRGKRVRRGDGSEGNKTALTSAVIGVVVASVWGWATARPWVTLFLAAVFGMLMWAVAAFRGPKLGRYASGQIDHPQIMRIFVVAGGLLTAFSVGFLMVLVQAYGLRGAGPEAWWPVLATVGFWGGLGHGEWRYRRNQRRALDREVTG